MLAPFRVGILAMTALFVIVGIIVAGGFGLFALLMLLGLFRGNRKQNHYHNYEQPYSYQQPNTRTVYRMDPP